MSARTANGKIQEVHPQTALGYVEELSIKTGEKLFTASIVNIDTTTGLIEAATDASGKTCVGVMVRPFKEVSSSASGDSTPDVKRGIFLMANGDSIAKADIGKKCYVADDATVQKASANVVAGIIVDVTSEGVYVDFKRHN